MASGYFSCLSYEYASSVFSEEYERLQAAQLLSISFQWACFLAVLTALVGVIGDNTYVEQNHHS